MKKLVTVVLAVGIFATFFSIHPAPAQAQAQTASDIKAALEVWRVEMDYVKANRPSKVNGFLVGSASGKMGTIQTRKKFASIDIDAFSCALAESVASGEEWSAFVNENRAWTMSNVQLGKFAYPILAMVKSSNGMVFTIVPAVLKAKINIEPGAVLHSSGYVIESDRSIKTGDTLYVLMVGDNILSAEAIEGAKEGNESKPRFTAFPE